MTEHKLKGDTLIVTKNGVEAICICGWTSGPRFSGMAASVFFRDHQEDPNAPPPPVLADQGFAGFGLHTPSINCRRCGKTSYHPKDIEEGYCGYCHDWTAR